MAEGSVRERLAALSRRELAAVVAVALMVAGGIGLWYVRSLPKPVQVRAGVASHPARGEARASPPVLIVHVAGFVRHPGVYEFHEGDRVVDAIQAAGGPKRKANLDALNLAAPITDGQQILVPGGVGDSLPITAIGASATPGLVNINTASEPELEELPGVGPVLAQRIVDYRTEHGPFPDVNALDDVSGIGPATLENLRPLVTV